MTKNRLIIDDAMASLQITQSDGRMHYKIIQRWLTEIVVANDDGVSSSAGKLLQNSLQKLWD